jgi:hypothetical protein
MKVHELAAQLEELEIRGYGDSAVTFGAEDERERIHAVNIAPDDVIELASEELQ